MYVPLDVNFPDDPKIIAAGLDGSGLYAHALCLAKRLMEDGKISRAHLYRFGANDELIDQLIEIDLFTEDDDLWITAWLSHNESAEEIDSRRSADAKRKRSTRRKRPAGQVEDVQPDADTASEDVRPLEVEIETEGQRPQGLRSAAQRDEVLDAAVELLLERHGHHEKALTKDSPSGWLHAVRKGMKDDYADTAHAALVADPSLDADALADLLAPPRPVDTSRRLAEYVAEGTADFEGALDNVRRIPRVGPKAESA